MDGEEALERAREQDRRADAEDTAAFEAVDPEQARAHARRADRASYLRDRLAEQAAADADAAREGGA